MSRGNNRPKPFPTLVEVSGQAEAGFVDLASPDGSRGSLGVLGRAQAIATEAARRSHGLIDLPLR